MDNVKRTEEISSANPNKGTRVTLDQVLGSIDTVNYFHPAQALPDPNGIPEDDVLWTMTICICTMKNGWAVVGKSAPADPAMYDEAIGMKLAHEDCIRQIWPLLGFLLRQTIWENFEAGPAEYGPMQPMPGEKM